MTTLPRCFFQFDDGPIWKGYSHESTWNGFDNVAVDAATLQRIIEWSENEDDKDGFRSITPMDDGLFSLGWGYTTQIVPAWRAEFPQFKESDLPDIPREWRDSSWHNDACPSWLTADGKWQVYIAESDPAEREIVNGWRYAVMSPDDDMGHLGSDDWQTILNFVREHSNG
ncbi:MAG TPA: hypothetical protein VF077_07345 [Nitrospiraceae bacterium]